MNNMDILTQTFAEVFSVFAPFAFAAGVIAVSFSTILHFINYVCRSRSYEMHQMKKDIEKCQKIVDDLEKKYPPISPCDFHKDCLDCHLYNTSFCWKLLKERENK